MIAIIRYPNGDIETVEFDKFTYGGTYQASHTLIELTKKEDGVEVLVAIISLFQVSSIKFK